MYRYVKACQYICMCTCHTNMHTLTHTYIHTYVFRSKQMKSARVFYVWVSGKISQQSGYHNMLCTCDLLLHCHTHHMCAYVNSIYVYISYVYIYIYSTWILIRMYMEICMHTCIHGWHFVGGRQSRYSLTTGKPYLGFRLTPLRGVGGWA